MNMQLHDTFWRDYQVMVIFHSKLPLIENGVLSKEQVLNDLNLREQMKRINTYLFQKFREQGLNPIHLVFLGDNQKPAISDRPLMRRFDVRTNSPLHAGVYLFDQGTDIERSFGTFRTTIHAFVKIVKGPSPDISDLPDELIETRHHHSTPYHPPI